MPPLSSAPNVASGCSSPNGRNTSMSTGCATFGNASLATTPLRLLLHRGGAARRTFQLSADRHQNYTPTFTPKADLSVVLECLLGAKSGHSTRLFNQLDGASKQRWRNCQVGRLCGFDDCHQILNISAYRFLTASACARTPSGSSFISLMSLSLRTPGFSTVCGCGEYWRASSTINC